jgi:twinkle protein
MGSTSLIEGEFRALPPRGLSRDACAKFGVRVGKLGQDTVLAMDYRDNNGVVVAQKVRGADKSFTILGDAKQMSLFGKHLWPAKGKRIVITEGELDAVALCQMQDLRWPVVSVPNGAQNARKAILKELPWLDGYDEIILAFDADEAGRKAATECAYVLPPGKARIAEFVGFKDANEALILGEDKAILRAVWDARTWRPDGVVSLKDIRDRVMKPLEQGRPWPWPTMDAATFGRRKGEVIGFGAGTGIGKTDLFTQVITADVKAGIKCGVIYMEQGVGETGRRLAGKMVQKVFHVPDGSWTQEEFVAAWDALEATDLVVLYDNFGAMDWDTIKAQINYMVNVEGCEHIFMDHLTALVAGVDDPTKTLDRILSEMSAMAKDKFVFHYISHLTTPTGKSHEEGGRVSSSHFRGSRAIAFWSHFMFGLERDTQAEDPDERAVSTLRCLKDRNTGRAAGMTLALRYDTSTGMLSETSVADGFESEAATLKSAGF